MLSQTGLNFNTRTPGFQRFDISRNNYFCPPIEDAQRVFVERGVKTSCINNNSYFTASLNLENIDGTRQEKRISDEDKLNNLKTERKMAAIAEKYGYTVDTSGIYREEEEIIKRMTQSVDNDEKKQGKVLDRRRQRLADTIAEHGYKLGYDKTNKKLTAEKSLDLMDEELYGLYNRKKAVKNMIEDIKPDEELPSSALLPHYKI
jgi:hypothetical protein